MCVSVHKGGLNRGPADCIETIPQPPDLLCKVNCQVSLIQGVRNPRFDPTFPEEGGPTVERPIVLPEIAPVAILVEPESGPFDRVDSCQRAPRFLPPFLRASDDINSSQHQQRSMGYRQAVDDGGRQDACHFGKCRQPCSFAAKLLAGARANSEFCKRSELSVGNEGGWVRRPPGLVFDLADKPLASQIAADAGLDQGSIIEQPSLHAVVSRPVIVVRSRTCLKVYRTILSHLLNEPNQAARIPALLALRRFRVNAGHSPTRPPIQEPGRPYWQETNPPGTGQFRTAAIPDENRLGRRAAESPECFQIDPGFRFHGFDLKGKNRVVDKFAWGYPFNRTASRPRSGV